MYKVYLAAIQQLHAHYVYAWKANNLRAYKEDQKLARFITRRLARHKQKGK